VAVQQASQRLDALRQQADASPALTPDQRQQLDALLQQAQAQLAQAQTSQDASSVLTQTAQQVGQQLGDPNAQLRDEALAAMSETLAAEPQTQGLADALQHEDAQAASQAMQDLASHADQLSDVERQALSRALQRAANVGRSDARTSNALRDAAQAVASNSGVQQALAQADSALRDSIQSSQSQAAVNTTVAQLHELQSRVASGQPLNPDAAQAAAADSAAQALASGTPVALDSSAGASSRITSDPSSGQGGGAGSEAASGAFQPQAAPDVQAAENVFVPGRPDESVGQDQGQLNQPFTVRGAPRPYRDVLSQYAQSSRDYVDRPDISPAVRDLVKQYFQQLESNQ
jgi:hypothetical protein